MEGLVVQLVILLALASATAAIAHSKGRNAVGWFFVGFFAGCIGLIIVLCMSNLKEEQRRWQKADTERRMLREQLAQERLKSEAFRGHVRKRLDVHDKALDMNTRELAGSPDDSALLELEAGAPDAPPAGGEVLPAGSADFKLSGWFVATTPTEHTQVNWRTLKQMYAEGRINDDTLIWTGSMKDWRPLRDVEGLRETLL